MKNKFTKELKRKVKKLTNKIVKAKDYEDLNLTREKTHALLDIIERVK